jgi:hypothetical protein
MMPRHLQGPIQPPNTLLTYPFIELKGSKLVCRQHAVLTHVSDKNAFLDLLCDLAKLAELMGN